MLGELKQGKTQSPQNSIYEPGYIFSLLRVRVGGQEPETRRICTWAGLCCRPSLTTAQDETLNGSRCCPYHRRWASKSSLLSVYLHLPPGFTGTASQAGGVSRTGQRTPGLRQRKKARNTIQWFFTPSWFGNPTWFLVVYIITKCFTQNMKHLTKEAMILAKVSRIPTAQ